MFKSALVRCVRLVALIAVMAAVACVDLSTAPTPEAIKDSAKATRDSSDCISGYVVIDGIVICNP